MNLIKKYLRKKALKKLMNVTPKRVDYNEDGTAFPYTPDEREIPDNEFFRCYPIGCRVIISEDLIWEDRVTHGKVIGYKHYHDDPNSDKGVDNFLNLIILTDGGIVDELHPDPSGIQPEEKELQYNK